MSARVFALPQTPAGRWLCGLTLACNRGRWDLPGGERAELIDWDRAALEQPVEAPMDRGSP